MRPRPKIGDKVIFLAMLRLINKVLGRFDLALVDKNEKLAGDMAGDPAFMKVYHACRPFTMTTPERMYALYEGVRYTITNRIPGDFVECGVWKGGSSMVIAYTLLALGVKDRRIFLYDTFDGMSEPGEEDKDLTGVAADQLLGEADKEQSTSVWCYSGIDEVKKNLLSTGYPADQLQFIKGKVEDSIPATLPGDIALLRLDTDWYESTHHELVHLFPLLQKSGLLIIDDFGHWEGAKKAVVQYFEERQLHYYLGRIDYTGRFLVK